MLNSLALEQPEETADYAMYQVETGLEDLFQTLLYLRHNNQALFNEQLRNWEEAKAKIMDLDERIRAMENIVALENLMNRRNI